MKLETHELLLVPDSFPLEDPLASLRDTLVPFHKVRTDLTPDGSRNRIHAL
jgi:hypothetical protein